MPRLLLILLTSLLCANTIAEASGRKVQVAEPYIELHTGPGRGFPVFHVVDRGEWIEVIKRRTNWFKVVATNGVSGWTHQHQLEQTLNPEGEPVRFEETTQAGFISRTAEAGVLGGEISDTESMTLFVGYSFTRNISAELNLVRATGNFSSNQLINLSLLHQAFPAWRISPFFALGVGNIKTVPRETLVQAEDRSDLLAHVGIGAYAYISRNFALRGEYNNYVVFSSDDNNEDLREWKFGLVTFF